MDSKKKLHSGHRQRVRQRYINEGGLKNFNDHQILELLLFYSYHSQKDTNEVAHKILNRFDGSLINVFNSSPDEIMKKAGVSEMVAVQLSMISELVKYYLERTDRPYPCLSSKGAVERYVVSCYKGMDTGREIFRVLCLDKGMYLRNDIVICEGDEGKVDLSIKELVSKVLEQKSVYYVIMAHNHPFGTAKPSQTDINTTNIIKNYIEPLGIRLLDHIIVCGEESFSFAENRLCNLMYK